MKNERDEKDERAAVFQDYQKLPVVIQAAQWKEPGDIEEIVELYDDPSGEWRCGACGGRDEIHGWISTLEGGHVVCPNDWIIRGVQGEYYPCKPAIFQQTYQQARFDHDAAVREREARHANVANVCECGHTYDQHSQFAPPYCQFSLMDEYCDCIKFTPRGEGKE